MAIRLKGTKYIIDYYPHGRRGRRVVFTLPAGTTELQAAHIERELRGQKGKGTNISATSRISHLIPHYVTHCEMHQSMETARDKHSYYTNHIVPYFGPMHIADLSNAHIMAYKQSMKEKVYRGKPISNSTITKGLRYFSAFLKWADEEFGIHTPQLLRFKKLPHTRPVPVVLSMAEAMAFIDAADPPYNTLFKTVFYLGLRNRAARKLKWDDVDWTKRTIKTVEKGNKAKWHPLPDDLSEEYRRLYIASKSEWIFPSPVDATRPIRDVRKAVLRARKKAGIEKRVYVHLLRHSIATHMIDSDVDIRQIQAFLGHSQISTTEWYAQVSMEKKRQALEKAGIKTSKV